MSSVIEKPKMHALGRPGFAGPIVFAWSFPFVLNRKLETGNPVS
jgi:hypothetical protein